MHGAGADWMGGADCTATYASAADARKRVQGAGPAESGARDRTADRGVASPDTLKLRAADSGARHALPPARVRLQPRLMLASSAACVSFAADEGSPQTSWMKDA